MKVRECMATDTRVCVAESSCTAAGELMRRSQAGFLPVVDSLKTKRVVGVVTDRDLMLHLVRQPPARHIPVKACMTKAPTLISADAELEEAIAAMKRTAVRQLPVVQDGILVGVLSLLDIALAVRRQWAYVGPNVTDNRVSEIIEAIAVARAGAQDGPRTNGKPKKTGRAKARA
jgi:signal-transduction protein with cAMP-binding, CBS, and nucleotidyltransferase domain